jgi:RNA polymerase sigma-70 factor (ECF subfamily)
MKRSLRTEGASLGEIEELYRRDLDRFVRVSAAILGDREAARDAVHEGFAVAIRKRRSYAGRGAVESWLWQVVLNTVRNYRGRFRATVALDSDSVATPSVNGTAEVAEGLRAALLALPDRQRLVVFLHYYADLDYRRIAPILGIREGTVGATLNAARAALREHMKEAVQ